MRASSIRAVLLAAIVPAALDAQTLPAFTLDLGAGRGAHPERTEERWFRSDDVPAAHGTLAVRLGSRGRVRPVALLDYSFDVRDAHVTLECVRAPNGSCRESFPSTTGWGGGLGMRAALTDRLAAGVAAGIGRYDGPTRFALADLSVRVTRRVGLVAALRHVAVDDPESPRTWVRPLTFGVRLQ